MNAEGAKLPEAPTPEMIKAGADALEYVNDIGRWLAEELAKSVLERAFAAYQQSAHKNPKDPCASQHFPNDA